MGAGRLINLIIIIIMADLIEPVFGATVIYIACIALMVGGATQLVTCFMPWPGSGALWQIEQDDKSYWRLKERRQKEDHDDTIDVNNE